MNSREIREGYLRFFEQRGHQRIPSARLLPENDPSVLFTTAGMHPLVPFLLGEPHPLGRRLTSVQKCIRTNDIDEVGDPSHLTFFEMLGNWSLGDYFKEDSLAWSFEYLTAVLGIHAERLAVTVFAGDSNAPRDEAAASIWRRLGISTERIYYLPKADNWWGPAGATGPCGPDSEIFFDTGRPDHPGCGPGCACGKWFEIWNNVFMEYHLDDTGQFQRLRQRNVDTGLGLERTLAVLQGLDDIFHIDTLWPLVESVERLSGRSYADQPQPFRIIVDHLRASTFAIGDGALPSNTEAGYVVRRMIRRATRFGRELGIHENFLGALSAVVVDLFGFIYPELDRERETIASAIDQEETKFKRTLERGLRQYQKVSAHLLTQENGPALSGTEAFDLFETYGFPIELTVELAHEQGLTVDQEGFQVCYAAHRQSSRDHLAQKYTGGLADHSEQTTRLHTASHLLQQALRQVLGLHVRQMGSNITAERLRFDFSHPEKPTPEQLAEVEKIVNDQIQANLPVSMEIMPYPAAVEAGALAFFSERYGEQVKVYTIGNFSKEVCVGPHVTHTGKLGRFQIMKEEAVGRGVRRIRAVLYNP